jgi:hypothetical protein
MIMYKNVAHVPIDSPVMFNLRDYNYNCYSIGNDFNW